MLLVFLVLLDAKIFYMRNLRMSMSFVWKESCFNNVESIAIFLQYSIPIDSMGEGTTTVKLNKLTLQ